jgi:hypothetical protein
MSRITISLAWNRLIRVRYGIERSGLNTAVGILVLLLGEMSIVLSSPVK